jgi:hypothetical protein
VSRFWEFLSEKYKKLLLRDIEEIFKKVEYICVCVSVHAFVCCGQPKTKENMEEE